jgi:hypothetical protein
MPELRGAILSLFERDDEFRALCDDYGACQEAEHLLEGGTKPQQAMAREYQKLGLRLERELLDCIREESRG